METVTVEEAAARLSDLIAKAHLGEEIVVIANEGTAVRLAPVSPPRQPRFGSARGMFTIQSDFDDPLPEFAPYQR